MNGLDSYALLAIVALPMAGAGLLILIPGANVLAVRRFALAVALVTMLLSVYVFLAYDHSAGGIEYAVRADMELAGDSGLWPMADGAMSGITLEAWRGRDFGAHGSAHRDSAVHGRPGFVEHRGPP